MSLEVFVSNLESQLKDLRRKREAASGSEKGQLTRKINDCEAAMLKATRKGIQ